ncbi:MAG TPA: chemotaxis protein CheW [Kofleriaceae bacterium]|jgi:purine-binding chemotaxis protein CheW|nr:chemotaxis protein CheW [Kofleriaceae bacterium]
MADPGAPLRLVCFELHAQELALPIGDVRETLPLVPITRVVLTPPCLAGVFSLRGDIVPAIDLGILLGLRATEIGDDSRIVVVAHAMGSVGIVVDRLRDLRTIDGVEPPPPSLPPAVAALLRGVASTPTGSVRVLDANAILNAEPLLALRAHAEGRSA